MANILILEDDTKLGPLIKYSLEAEGHAVMLFDDVTNALAYCEKNNKVDIIIIDKFIKIDGALSTAAGIKLISRIRQIKNMYTPIIAISGSFERSYSGNEAKETAKTVGATEILAKPFSPDELICLLDRLISRF